MRTDSTRINDDMVQAARDFIMSTYGKEYVPEKGPRIQDEAVQSGRP